MLILAFALLAGSRTCSAVSVECSGCNVVAYTIHSRLSREDIDLHTPETLKASMEATCQSSGCGKKAGRVRGLMQGGRDGLRLDSRAFRRTKREYESMSVNSHLTRPMYAEAARLKRDANKMEEAQLQGTLAEFDAQVSLKEQQLLLKQKREIEALMQRAQRGRDELQLTRKQDVERRSQRFKNVMQELANLHTLESVQLRHYLEQQVVAGKRLDVA